MVKSPAWIRMSPSGTLGCALCVSDVHTIRMDGESDLGDAMGGWCV
jgi:hypothetical protein